MLRYTSSVLALCLLAQQVLSGSTEFEHARATVDAQARVSARASPLGKNPTLAVLIGPNQTALSGDDKITFLGRTLQNNDSSVSFDMNGVEIRTTVTNTTSLYAMMSQVRCPCLTIAPLHPHMY